MVIKRLRSLSIVYWVKVILYSVFVASGFLNALVYLLLFLQQLRRAMAFVSDYIV
jgi:hypothetical protein